MTCYFRHLKAVFKKAGVRVTEENRKEVDRIVHSIVGIGYKNCPATWREVKRRIAADEEKFTSELREALSKKL